MKAAGIIKALKPVQAALRATNKIVNSKPVKLVREAAAKAGRVKKLVTKGVAAPFVKVADKLKLARHLKKLTAMASKYGIPEGKLKRILEAASKHDLRIFVRKGNKASVAQLAKGAIPKPDLVKAKTINELDLLLNPKLTRGDLGLVGYFKPELPAKRPPGVSRSQWKKAQARSAERAAEFADNADLMAKLQLKMGHPVRQGHAKPLGDFQVQITDRGLVQSIDPDTHKISNIAGDTDVLQITRGDRGALSTGKGDKMDDLLLEADLSEHGPHLWWQPRTKAELAIDKAVLESHVSGGVLEVSADGFREVSGKDVPGFADRLKAAASAK
jgi:hypothetical protein